MIKYNNSTINDWNFGDDNIAKVYRNGAVVYYKVTTSGGTPQYDVCYAVVADITQYQETEFVDVFDNATEKWYKLNNLNQYEQYGVYGSGRNITYYNGKLTIDDGYEYMYSGSSWVNVGEVSESTATLPNVPFSVNYNAKNYDASTQTLIKTSGQLVDVDAVITEGTPTVNDGYLTIAKYTRAKISGYQNYFNRDNNNPNLTIVSKQRTDGINGHMFANRDSSYNWMYRCYSNKLTLHGSSETGSIGVTTQPVIESVRVNSTRNVIYNNYTNNTTSSASSFSYGSTNSGSFGMFQGYANSTGEYFVGDFYWVYMSQNTLTDEQIQQVIDYNEGGSQSVYPLYYTEKSDPLNNLSFSSMTEADTYAYNNCVYDGMKATIDGDLYEFDSESGWTEVQYYYKVEDVTASSQGGSGWTVTGSSTNNPNPSYYDDFSTAPNSTSYQYKVAKVTIFGYDSFTYYLRSSGYSGAYLVSTNIDEIQTQPTSITYSSSSAITNTYNFNKAAGSQVNLSNYRRVTYNNLDKTVKHTFYVLFYNGYTGSTSYINNINATLLIPKDQSQENWEQVTFSASTNISGSSKNLYIDGNNSSSGGTNNFFSRWMVGLPSGSHSSYVSYSDYNYCPSVTSATFTSVEGGVRQVDYSYNSISTKTLQFRLVDESGSTITTANTVYYTVMKYNECGSGQNNPNLTLPSSQSVANGGRFTFSSSYNRHYIYGYQPNIALNTSYYSDNYSTYFDIPYTKLNTEAVTITYTTYDPNDSETPSFSTDISWPYGNSGTSSTTLASYDVPYTYSYEVKQTSNLFSASTASYTYTAGQASRTITFTSLYPNNRVFSTVADMEAYQYAWEGMIANVGDTKYKYENGEWTEIAYIAYEYMETSSSQYFAFNTNYYPTESETLVVKMKINSGKDWGTILGWSGIDSDTNVNDSFRFTTVTNNPSIIARKGSTSGLNYYNVGNNPITLTMPLAFTSTTYTYQVDGEPSTYYLSYSVGTGSYPSSSAPLHIFGWSSNYNKYSFIGRIYYVQVLDANGNIVKNYVPSDSNGTPIWIETNSGLQIFNTNTGIATLGPEI